MARELRLWIATTMKKVHTPWCLCAFSLDAHSLPNSALGAVAGTVRRFYYRTLISPLCGPWRGGGGGGAAGPGTANYAQYREGRETRRCY